MALQVVGGLACLQHDLAFHGSQSPLVFTGYSVISAIASQSKVMLSRAYKSSCSFKKRKAMHVVKNSASSSSESNQDDSKEAEGKVPFGYSRKDVLLIGLGVTALGVGLKYGLEFVGVDSLQAGNAVQLLIVLGLTVGWISTYIFRVANKDMTYAQQLREYENQVMQKRLDSLSEAELEALLQQVEEEKQRLSKRD